MNRKALAALVILTVVACGKRGDPRPPVPIIPQATSDLQVTQRADQVILSWSFPSLTTTGRSLTDVRRISVFRYVEDLPASALGGNATATANPPDPAQPQPIVLFSKVPTLPQAQFAQLATRVDSIEKANLAAATAGARLLYADTPPFRSQDGRPVRVTYAVVTEGATARSEYSNMVSLVPLPVATAPANLTATPKANGVVLAWQAPATSVQGQEAPVIQGYHVFRLAPGETPTQFTTPINNAPVTGTTYTDTPAYGEHEYRVAAVANEGPPRLQGALSAPVRATFADLVPPPPPATVTALVETNLVRLLWDPVATPDLRGYRVYRIEGTIRLKLSPAPVPETTFTDIAINPGIAYTYEITSVDQTGNESAPVRSDSVTVPKTP